MTKGDMTVPKEDSILDEYETIREKIEQKIRDIDKQMARLTKEKTELVASLQKA